MRLTTRSAFRARNVFHFAQVLWHRIPSSKKIYTAVNIFLVKKTKNIYVATVEGSFDNPTFDPDAWREDPDDDDDDDDDEQEVNTTQPCQPGTASTP